MIVHETEEVFFFFGENRADISSHFFAVAASFKRHIPPGKPGHGIELHEVEVIFAFAPDLGENFVEGEFLVKKSRACICLLYTSPSPRDRTRARMPSSA